MPLGLYNSTIISSDFGDNVAIDWVNLLSHYQIGNEVLILQVNELARAPTAKFGNGIIEEGKEEQIRIWMELGNENGGLKVIPFENMQLADAYIKGANKLKNLTIFSNEQSSTQIGEGCEIVNGIKYTIGTAFRQIKTRKKNWNKR